MRHNVSNLLRSIVCLAVAVGPCPSLAAEPDASTRSVAADSPLGKRIDDFELRDFHGAKHRLSDYRDAPIVVVVFLGTECPLARLYSPRLVALEKEYAPRGVQFLAINSNRQDSVTELTHFARTFGITFPLLKDPGNVVADRFGAQRTPEAFVLDAQRVVRYWGRIDDQYGLQGVMGYQRPKATRRDLAEALDDLLAGRQVRRPLTRAPGCLIGRVRQIEPHGDITWCNQISRLFQKHCQSCHRPGEIAPFPLLTYEDVQGWEPMIREVVEQQRMPPWGAGGEFGHFLNDPRLSAEEKQLLFDWIDNGSPEGDPADLPPPRTFPEGWNLPREPDQVIYMDDKPFTVPAEGIVEYQWFYVDPGWTEGKWVAAAECRPGNRAVVHHVTVYYKPPGGSWDLRLGDKINLLCGYAPGKTPVASQYEEACFYLPAGTQLAFEMHYTPVGSVQQDRSCIGLVFADPEKVKRRVTCVMIANTEFAIPPHAANHRVEASYTLPEESLLYCMSPHMHLRGKAFRFEAYYPSGDHEILLDVPQFDFNWQNNYLLRKPLLLPRGTIVRCVAHFDNSEDNLANPNPEATVRWGDQTWEEMMIGTLVLAPTDPAAFAETRPFWRRWTWLSLALGALFVGAVLVRRRTARRSAAIAARSPHHVS